MDERVPIKGLLPSLSAPIFLLDSSRARKGRTVVKVLPVLEFML